jgi:hypothetical protein
MGLTRNGARTFLALMAKACKMSRLPGFQTGLNLILGPGVASDVMSLWNPLCTFIDGLNSLDNFFNQRDTANDDGAGEDASVGV